MSGSWAQINWGYPPPPGYYGHYGPPPHYRHDSPRRSPRRRWIGAITPAGGNKNRGDLPLWLSCTTFFHVRPGGIFSLIRLCWSIGRAANGVRSRTPEKRGKGGGKRGKARGRLRSRRKNHGWLEWWLFPSIFQPFVIHVSRVEPSACPIRIMPLEGASAETETWTWGGRRRWRGGWCWYQSDPGRGGLGGWVTAWIWTWREFQDPRLGEIWHEGAPLNSFDNDGALGNGNLVEFLPAPAAGFSQIGQGCAGTRRQPLPTMEAEGKLHWRGPGAIEPLVSLLWLRSGCRMRNFAGIIYIYIYICV